MNINNNIMLPQPTNPNVMPQSTNVGMHMPLPGAIMQQQQSPQQMQPGPAPTMPQQPPPDKMDNISKVKTLINSLREETTVTLKSAAQVLHQHNCSDLNIQKVPVDSPVLRFDKNVEEFFSHCDQIELHLRTAITCIQQSQSAAHYVPVTVLPSRFDAANTQETILSYPQYMNTVRLQISYAKDIYDTLVAAAQKISPTE